MKNDLTGKFGRLVVIRDTGSRRHRSVLWECLCDCGKFSEVLAPKLVKGRTKSCGCLRVDLGREKNRTHGLSNTRLHKIWAGIRKRCGDENFKYYHRYGGRGITICERWSDPTMFFLDMGDPPSDAHSIERIDNNGDYSPENCRWATPKEQANNRSSNRTLTYCNETKTLAEWGEIFNFPSGLIAARINLGWDLDRVMTEPIRVISKPSKNGKRLKKGVPT